MMMVEISNVETPTFGLEWLSDGRQCECVTISRASLQASYLRQLSR